MNITTVSIDGQTINSESQVSSTALTVKGIENGWGVIVAEFINRHQKLEAAITATLWDKGDLYIEMKAKKAEVFGVIQTDADIAADLNISDKRVGQLINTAQYFANEYRRYDIFFGWYEVARKANNSRPTPLPIPELCAIIFAAKSATEIKDAVNPQPKAESRQPQSVPSYEKYVGRCGVWLLEGMEAPTFAVAETEESARELSCNLSDALIDAKIRIDLDPGIYRLTKAA